MRTYPLNILQGVPTVEIVTTPHHTQTLPQDKGHPGNETFGHRIMHGLRGMRVSGHAGLRSLGAEPRALDSTLNLSSDDES